MVIVDDEEPFLDFLASMLGDNLGWGVRTFTRPLAALAALPHIDAAIIVSDYWMPELNGFQFIDAAARLRPGVPCIMMSGHPIELADQPPGGSPPVRAFLPKPLSWRKLADEIARHAPAVAGATPPAQPDPASASLDTPHA